jgi:hypothetical protein
MTLVGYITTSDGVIHAVCWQWDGVFEDLVYCCTRVSAPSPVRNATTLEQITRLACLARS